MRQLIKFGCVGIVGSLINLCVYYFFLKYCNFSINVSAILAFFAAVTSNYIFNSSWTFLSKKHLGVLTFKDWGHYVFGNSQGLLVNLVVLNLLLSIAHIQNQVLAQMVGISCGMIFNFFYVKNFVFK